MVWRISLPAIPMRTADQFPRKALVVEPDKGAAELCRSALEKDGYEVRCVDTGVLALIAARETAPDLVLLATQLRDVPGNEVVAWMKADPSLGSRPVIMLGSDTEQVAEYGFFLRKPLSAAALRRTVGEATRS